jgi:hypothetical protein
MRCLLSLLVVETLFLAPSPSVLTAAATRRGTVKPIAIKKLPLASVATVKSSSPSRVAVRTYVIETETVGCPSACRSQHDPERQLVNQGKHEPRYRQGWHEDSS